jgi:hypothetical protein
MYNGELYYIYNTEDIMKKILIKLENKQFIGYLLEDMPTKFRALNESKMVEYHYPKHMYTYEIVEEK